MSKTENSKNEVSDAKNTELAEAKVSAQETQETGIKQRPKLKAGKFSGIVITKFKARGQVYQKDEEYFTDDKKSLDYLINTRRLRAKKSNE